jgi:hypothetical protein
MRGFRPAQPALLALLLLCAVARAGALCTGDCDGDGTVTIDEFRPAQPALLALLLLCAVAEMAFLDRWGAPLF